MKKLFLSTFVFFILACANTQTPYPSENDIAANKNRENFYTYTFILYEKPFRIEYFYSFFGFLDDNNINSSFFIPLDISDPQFSSLLNRQLSSLNNQSYNIIYVKTSEKELLNQYDDFIQKANIKVHLFPKEEISSESSQPIIMPENFNYIQNDREQIKLLQDHVFIGNLLKKLTLTPVSNKNPLKNQGEILYVQGKTIPEASFQFLTKDTVNDDFQEKKSSISLNSGRVYSLFLELGKVGLFSINQKQQLFNYYILNFKHSFLFFDFLVANPESIDIYSFFNPISLSQISIQDFILNADIDAPIYQVHITVTDQNIDNNNIIGDYRNGVLNFKLNANFLPINYRFNPKKHFVSLNKGSVAYDFAMNFEKENQNSNKIIKDIPILLKDEKAPIL